MPEFGSEMQAGGRRGNGAGHLCENCLITLHIIWIAGPFDVGRKRNGTSLKEIIFAIERNHSLAIRADFFDTRRRAVDFRHVIDAHFSTRFNQHFQRAGPSCLEKENSILLSSENLRRAHHAGVVQDNQITAERNSPSSANFRCSIRCWDRCSTIIRDRPDERAGRCAISSPARVVVSESRELMEDRSQPTMRRGTVSAFSL